MKKFLEMIEQVRRQTGIPVLIDSLDPMKTEKYPDLPTEAFFHMAEQCQPFVFFPTNETPEEIDGEDFRTENLAHQDDLEHFKFDAPFQVWSAEMFGENHYITVPRDEFGPVGVSILAFMAVEQKPTEWTFFGYFKVYRNDGTDFRIVCLASDLDLVAKKLVERIYREKTGTDQVRARVKIGSGKEKRHITIRKIVYVKPKRKIESSEPGESRTIDWTHRWAVRGHWRDAPGKLGKDRNGTYCVEGKTWVQDFVKGPEGAPLISKVRVQKAEEITTPKTESE